MVYKSNANMDEKEIFDRICKGDEKALEFLYKKYYRMMTKLVISNSGTEEEARDVYQDALVVFWQKARSGNLVLTSKMSTYIYSICQNLWRKELDRKKRLSNEEKDSAESMDMDSPEREKMIARCLEQLGETCRKVSPNCSRQRAMIFSRSGLSMSIDSAESFSSLDSRFFRSSSFLHRF